MNCIIVDDEENGKSTIAQFVINRIQCVQEFPNAIQAIKFLNHTEVDLIF
jgi:two-component SAPR family response regulator